MLLATFIGSLIAGTLTIVTLRYSDFNNAQVLQFINNTSVMDPYFNHSFTVIEPESVTIWEVNTSNYTCIFGYGILKLEIAYEVDERYAHLVKGVSKLTEFDVHPWAEVLASESMCGDRIQILTLAFGENILGLTFKKKGDSIFLNSINVDYSLNPVYSPAVKYPGFYKTFIDDLKEFPTVVGNSYLCNVTERIAINSNVTLVVDYIHIEAFHNTSEKIMSPPRLCSLNPPQVRLWVIILGAIALSFILIVISYTSYRFCRCYKLCHRKRATYEEI